MINVITGQPRNGKSQRMMAEILDVIIKENDKREKAGKPRRPIYIDIDGVNAPDTPTKLPDCITDFEREKIWFGEHDDEKAPADYWKPPYGSIFVFDECHKRYWVQDTSGSISKEPTTMSLNEHGHAGHDIWLLTQFPQYIHTHIRGLVQEHWHVKRVLKLRRAKVYKWTEFYRDPRSETAFKNAFEVESFKFKKKYEDTYKSASEHAPMKMTIPKVLYFPVAGLILLIGLTIYFGKDSIFFKKDKEVEQVKDKQAQTDKQVDELNAKNATQAKQIEQMQAQLDDLKQKYLPKHIATLAEFEDVRPAMIISSTNGGCVAFNTYGEPLTIPDTLCQDMDNHPSLIPRSRQARQTQQVNKPTTIDFNNSMAGAVANPMQATNTTAQPTEVKYFDHTKDFK